MHKVELRLDEIEYLIATLEDADKSLQRSIERFGGNEDAIMLIEDERELIRGVLRKLH